MSIQNQNSLKLKPCNRENSETNRFVQKNRLSQYFSAFGSVQSIEIFNLSISQSAIITFAEKSSTSLAYAIINNCSFNLFGIIRVQILNSFQIRIQTELLVKPTIIQKLGLSTQLSRNLNDKTSGIQICSIVKIVEQKDPNFNKIVNYKSILPQKSFEKKDLWKIGTNFVSLINFNEIMNREPSFPDIFALNQKNIINHLQTQEIPNNIQENLKEIKVSFESCLFTETNHLLNFFGLFGSVTRIVVNQTSDQSIVEFESILSCNFCLDSIHLKNVFSRFNLRVCKNFPPQKNLIKHISGNFQQFFPPKLNKNDTSGFKNNNWTGISAKVHLKFKVRDFHKEIIVCDLVLREVKRFCRPLNVKKSLKIPGTDFGFEIEYFSEEEALLVYVKLNGTQVDKATLSVSFVR